MSFRRERRLMSACISDLPSARSCGVTVLKRGGVLTPCDPIFDIRNPLFADWHLIGGFLQGHWLRPYLTPILQLPREV